MGCNQSNSSMSGQSMFQSEITFQKKKSLNNINPSLFGHQMSATSSKSPSKNDSRNLMDHTHDSHRIPAETKQDSNKQSSNDHVFQGGSMMSMNLTQTLSGNTISKNNSLNYSNTSSLQTGLAFPHLIPEVHNEDHVDPNFGGAGQS